jgi:hypothetical protein
MHPSNDSCGGEKRWYCVISGWLCGYASVIAQNHNSLHCKILIVSNCAKRTHLCCGIVKQNSLWYRHHTGNASHTSNAWRVTMSAVAEVLSTVSHNPDPRGSDLPTCPVCADSMVAAEASAYLTDNVISYLWTCDTCGYGFVTKHALKRFACN